jgi:hypothetical protein
LELPAPAVDLAYRTANLAAQTQDAKPEFILTDTGDSVVPLDRIELRYWFTDDSGQSFNFHCDWARLGCGTILSEFKTTASGEQYLSLRFSPQAGELQPGEDSGEIKIRFNRSDWSPFDQTNHYSFAPQAEYAGWQNVTVYFDDQLVWGTEPGGQRALAAAPGLAETASPLPPSASPTASSPTAGLVQTTVQPATTEAPGTSLPSQPNGQGTLSSAALLLIGLLAGLSLGLLTIRFTRR